MKEKNFLEKLPIIQSNQIATAVLDEDLNYLEANNLYLNLVQTEISDLIQNSFLQNLLPEKIEDFKFNFKKELNKKLFVQKQIEFLTNSKQNIYVDLKASYLDIQDKKFIVISLKPSSVSLIPPKNFLNTNDYRSKIKFLTKKLIEQNNFVNMVSHEITSPIGAIKSLIQVLDSKTIDPIDKNYYEMILKSLEHVLRVGNNLLMVGDLETYSKIEKEGLDLKSLLNEILEEYTPIAFRKNIMLFFNSTVDELRFPVEKEKFRFAISNLLSNAIKFSPKEKMVELKLEVENERPIIYVIDSGIGISEEQKQFLFQKFSKARRQGTLGEKSTGLGLYIVKEIIEKHGGKISFESKLKLGTTFKISL